MSSRIMASRVLQRLAATSRRGVRIANGSALHRLQPQRCVSSLGHWSSWGEPGKKPPSVSNGKSAWQAHDDIDIQRVTQKAIVHELTQQQTRTIESIVPWFLDTMPESYFQVVPENFRMDHIKAIAALTDAQMDLHLNLKSHLPDGRQVLTFVRPGTEPGTLLKMAKELPDQAVEGVVDAPSLSRVAIFSAQDESMSLNLFVYGKEATDETFNRNVAAQHILEYAKQVQAGEFEKDESVPKPNPLFEKENLERVFQNCTEAFLTRANPRRFLRSVILLDQVSGSESTAVSFDPVPKSLSRQDSSDADRVWVDVAVANSLSQTAFEQTIQLLFLHKFDVQRAHLDVVSDGDNGTVTLLRLLVQPFDTDKIDEKILTTLSWELKRWKWLDPSTAHLVFDRYPWLNVRRGEIITAFCSLLHPVLAKKNQLIYSKANILETVTKERYINISAAIADLFLDRFHHRHPISDEEFEERTNELVEQIEADVEDTLASEILKKMLEITKHTLRTNMYLSDRYALGLRLDPRIMVSPEDDPKKELPYGVIFVHGRRFNGYHVRFRDIARGGLRLVTPASPEQYALESAHQYDECYGLAFAQQLKNKDIPEGGSKAVNLINVTGLSKLGKEFVMRKSVKAFTDSILDLVVDTPETREHVVDFVGRKEVLYLGPDEQVIPQDIEWVIRRAAKRGYETPNAFMSSKPRSGINHKQYGVTSEGVNVFLDVALRRALGIDPTKEPFRVKMTGGPDGDVAGNELKILFREYGENAKIVGLADGFGCAEDPDGLNHEELLRLVNRSEPISSFDTSKLGPKGVLHLASTEVGFKARNSMHNRIEADAFIPAGGRPNTIDIHNYRQFLKEDGTPSCPLIVEGANLFVTAEARQKLYDEAKVLIVKDSSANKCGVITSSYEICAAMLLSEQEFLDNKEAIVADVVTKLRELAKREAELLFREFYSYHGSLPYHSQAISNAVNSTTDALSAALDQLPESEIDDLLLLFKAHLPPTMVAMAFDRVRERVPEQYIKNAIASGLASKLVYKEGTKFIESCDESKLAETALTYLKHEKEVARLMEMLSKTKMRKEEKDKILKLLDSGGARTALKVFDNMCS